MVENKVDQITAIAALILESPFDALKSVISHLVKRYHVDWVPYAKQLGFKIAKKHFPSLNLDGIFPIQVITKIPKDIPVLLIHSKKDKVIPINSSRKLYVKLNLAGHKHTYLLELNEGAHGKLLAGTEGKLYQDVTHAFLQKYELPHDSLLAQSGNIQLIQPTVADIMLRIKKRKACEDDDIESDSISK